MWIFCLLLNVLRGAGGQSFSQVLDIYSRLDRHSGHFVDVRPVLDQSQVVTVTVGYSILSIVDVSELSQSVTYNIYFHLMWRDEIVVWNASQYGGVHQITAGRSDLWRPRLVVLNSIGERELYKEDSSPLQVDHTGQVSWTASGPLATSCSLDLSRYPVDDHVCHIKLMTMSYQADTVQLLDELNQNSRERYLENSEWILLEVNMSRINYLVDGFNRSGLQINVHFKRRPISLMLGFIIPITFISFLNLFVFLIPAESGEKVSAGITILLSQAMYLSTVSSMLPRSTQPLPLVTYYLFLLIINSAVIVFLCIIVVALQNWEEKMSRILVQQRDSKPKDLLYAYEEKLHLKAEMLVRESPQHVFSATPEPHELSQDSSSQQSCRCGVPARVMPACSRLSNRINTFAFLLVFAVWVGGTTCLIVTVKT
ncbi:acetylcholine receptor subunit alpha-like [Biomphalaria glabrata]|uniref:Acetylcholine receptor subunit alpha-like n=1 Tax=Biomphalaria glabrata TaxID=6526 RepID=A0A9W2YIU3_BIOGL|nr:acetylcholine receptor subunit alpha-like [Biomphalaria glabrata]